MFHVATVTTGNPGFGTTLRSFRRYTDAKRYAQHVATQYDQGVVIVDERRNLADWGCGWSAADDCEQAKDAPSYARRWVNRARA